MNFRPFMIILLITSMFVLAAVRTQATALRAASVLSSTSGGVVQVSFNSVDLTGNYPHAYSFGVTATTSPGSSIVKLSWQFGDGSSKDSVYCCLSQVSEVQYHAYSQPGMYTVSVIAYDNAGNSGSVKEQVSWPTGLNGQQPDPMVTVTFQVNGMASGVSGTVLTIDGIQYVYQDLPVESWSVGSTHSVSASPILVSTTNGKQYTWKTWTGGDGLSGPSGTFTTPSSPAKVTANYGAQHFLTVDLTGDPNGAINVSPQVSGTTSPYALGFYDSGATVTLTAVPNSGYAFSSWTGTGAGRTKDPTRFTVSVERFFSTYRRTAIAEIAL